MHQSNDDTIPSGDQSSAPDAEPPSTPSESEIAVSVLPPNQDPVDQMIITNAADVEQPFVITGTSAAAQNDISDGEEGDNSVDGAASNNQSTKQRRSTDGAEIGAVQVDEQAPRINRRFYLGLDRASVRARNALLRQARSMRMHGAADAGDSVEAQITQVGRDTSDVQRSSLRGRLSILMANVTVENPEGLVSATLVEEEDEGEVFEAKPVGFFERKQNMVLSHVFLFGSVLLLAVLLSVFVAHQPEGVLTIKPSMQPSMQPSSSPSFTQGPTLEIVQTRGHVLCGLSTATIESREGLRLDLCRAIAAVLFGNPENFEPIPVTSTSRFQQLAYDRSVDLLIFSDTHTVEREVRERTTGAGFTFSSPYYYDGMGYFGNDTFVRCAEEKKRFGDCSPLLICVENSTTNYDTIESYFPLDFFTVASSLENMISMLLSGICNVITDDRSILLELAQSEQHVDGQFVVGNKTISKEPLAIVTRKDDREFSDIINWVVQALFYGEEQELTKDSSPCQNYTNWTSRVSDLDFLNAVYCVGNYGELYDEIQKNRGMNHINTGTTGMLYAIPFGELDNEDYDGIGDIMNISASLLNRIGKETGSLNCGVIVPHNFTGNSEKSDMLIGMSIAYCQSVAAALFNGDFNNVNLLNFTNNDAFVALNNGTIDVLAGAEIKREYDFASPSLGGFHFSTPYYYGNEIASDDVRFFSFATREDDALFSSFVNCVVLATIYAQENDIKKKKSEEMPLLSMFGDGFNWVARDAIGYSGSYDQLYEKYFSEVAEEERGRNILNERGVPQIHSFPGLNHNG